MTADLVSRAQQGDHEAFAALVRPHIDRLHGLAGLFLRDAARAEDALQDALLRAWRDLPRLREPDRFEAWLRRLVVNASHDEGRRLRRRRGEQPLEPFHDPGTGGGIGHLVDRDELARGFRRLKEDERTAIALRFYLDLSSADAADAMGLREVTYRSRLHRALKVLRAELSAEARTAIGQEDRSS